jgi:hypothetical protein
MAVFRDISEWHLAVGLLAMFVLYELDFNDCADDAHPGNGDARE